VTIEEEDEDPHKINILETKGHHEVKGSPVENPNRTTSLKTKQINISMKAELKFMNIGDYWVDAIGR